MATTTRTLRRSSSALVLAAAAVVTVVPVLAAAPAEAKGGSPAVQSGGACIGGGVWKLKAKHDDGRLEVEYQVDTNRAGQAFHVIVTDDNVSVFNGTKTTTAPSGSFTLALRPVDRPGAEVIRTKATFAGHTCTGSVTV
jgi:hypothetical protein